MKGLLKFLIPIIFIVTIIGCSNNEDKIELLFFSEIQATMQEEIEDMISNAISVEKDEFIVNIHPVTYERLIVEIASHNGDLLFLDEELMSAAYDPDGLYRLDEALDDAWFALVPDKYKAIDSETGELHVYALPLNNESPFLQTLGVELEAPLVAIIPVYSDNKAFSIKLLKYIIENN
ncbi:hypothetical protein [Halalkalibacter alkalisediminis]|uniref:Uncharacterized protein n=1 Tax=Halalkalibacter alkalisediminis TaxID=935616 RepID=A0ABV6NC05_9BACI|nr:hypothetical protein [Halalkalibacter alkalisediminis]